MDFEKALDNVYYSQYRASLLSSSPIAFNMLFDLVGNSYEDKECVYCHMRLAEKINIVKELSNGINKKKRDSIYLYINKDVSRDIFDRWIEATLKVLGNKNPGVDNTTSTTKVNPKASYIYTISGVCRGSRNGIIIPDVARDKHFTVVNPFGGIDIVGFLDLFESCPPNMAKITFIGVSSLDRDYFFNIEYHPDGNATLKLSKKGNAPSKNITVRLCRTNAR